MPKITEAELQTGEWRNKQIWYKSGRHNECEKYQVKEIESITGFSMAKTRMRLHTDMLCMSSDNHSKDEMFDWTENFDGVQDTERCKLYFNLKMICGQGGFQKRSLRDVYLFMKTQLRFLKKYYSVFSEREKVYFINVLDGAGSYRYRCIFECLASKKEFRCVYKYFFCGDMSMFYDWHIKNKHNYVTI